MKVTTLAIAATLASSTAMAEVRTHTFAFENEGSTLKGVLYLPENYADTKLPTIVVTGAWTSVQQQMPETYARALVDRGFAAVTFDFRGWGASGDLPGGVRYIESPRAKTSDLRAAFNYVAGLPEVDPNAINGLGICSSAGYMVDAAAGNPLVKRVGLVAPWLHNAKIVEAVYGGADNVKSLIEASRRAEAAGGEVIPAAGPEGAEGVLMPIGGYYYEPSRGAIPEYDNQWNNAGWEGWLTYAPADHGGRLDKPLAVVHSDAAAIPEGIRTFLSGYGGQASELWLDGVPQFDFYDDETVVTKAADAVAAHFRATATRVAGAANAQPVAPEVRLSMIDAVTSIAAGADRHDWDRVRSAFADKVTLDYTSLWGGEPTTQDASEVVAQWRNFLPGFDTTQHLVTNHTIVAFTGDTATLEADFQATHRIGSNVWMLAGRYRYGLVNSKDVWKVDKLSMEWTHEIGDRDLIRRASERAPKRQRD